MRTWLPLALICSAACGSGDKQLKPPEPPPRDLGPIEMGPVPPEQRHVDAETYTIDVEGPPAAAVKEKVVATVTLRTKGDLYVQNVREWKVEPQGPRDTDVIDPVLTPPPEHELLPTTLQYKFTVVPLRVGTKHVAFRFGGQVCNHDFCDVVADQVSFNLDVK